MKRAERSETKGWSTFLFFLFVCLFLAECVRLRSDLLNCAPSGELQACRVQHGSPCWRHPQGSCLMVPWAEDGRQMRFSGEILESSIVEDVGFGALALLLGRQEQQYFGEMMWSILISLRCRMLFSNSMASCLKAVSSGKILLQACAVSFYFCPMENDWVKLEHLHCGFFLY